MAPLLTTIGIFYGTGLLSVALASMSIQDYWEDGKMNRRIAIAIVWPIALVVWLARGIAELYHNGMGEL